MNDSIFNDAVYLDDVPKKEWTEKYIGNGYRSVCYAIDHERKGRIVFFGYDKAGVPKTFICPHKSHVKYVVKYDTNEKDIYNRYVATRYFDNSSLRRKYLDQCDDITVIEALRPEQEFLQELFGKVVFDDDFNTQQMRVQSLDIETEISDQFMKPSVADNRVNMITIYDSLTNKFYTWSLQHCKKDFSGGPLEGLPESSFEIFEFNDNEDMMLEHFVDWINDNRADVLYGWNIKGYDIPYLYTRLTKLFGKNQADRLSPVGRCFVKEVNHDNARADVAAEINVSIDGVFQSDGLLLYRDKFKIAGSTLDGGYSLDNVGEAEGLGNKVHYTGTLKNLYVEDWQKFYVYNVQDVALCHKIDVKCGLTNLARRIAGIGLCNYDSIYSSLGYIIGSCIAFSKYRLHGETFVSYLKDKKQFGSGFEGAFVFPCTPNVYRGGIGCIDFASLYPSIIRTLNISPETYIGKVLVYFKDKSGGITMDPMHEQRFDPYSKEDSIWGADDDGNERKIVVNAGDPEIDHLELKLPGERERRRPITVEQLKRLLDTKCIWTPNNTLFLKHEEKDGVVAKWCEFFYSQRKAMKKREMKIFHTLHNDEAMKGVSAEEKTKMESDMELYHSIQMSYKILINSIYGAFGSMFSVIADPNISQSITRMGRFCNKSSAEFVRQTFIKRYDAPQNYVGQASGDTDSVFLNLDALTKYYAKKRGISENLLEWKQEDRDQIWNTLSKFVDDEVNGFVRSLAHSFCHTSKQNILTYELEYMSACGIYEGKKHYATLKIFDEGDSVCKIKYSGIELKKASLPKFVKKYLQECYEGVLLHGWTEKDYSDYMNRLYDEFKTFSIDDISFWKGYNTARESAGFLQMAQTVNPETGKTVGTTGIAKAATYFNQIIQKMELGKKYEQLRLGDKVRFCYIDENNPYRINVMAYKDGQWPAEFNGLFKPDYKTMFEKTVLDPLKRYREACRFQDIDPSKQVVFDIFSI